MARHAAPQGRRGALALTLIVAALGLGTGAAPASAAPVVEASWSFSVQPDSARLGAKINPNGSSTFYHVEYLTQAAYEANGGSFAGALRTPPVSEISIGAGPAVTVQRLLFGLLPSTTYRYRVVTTPAASPADSGRSFTTQSPAGALLPDSRGWEMVSPVDKNGGTVEAPGAIAGGGVLQAAAAGGSVTYGSAASFAGGQGAPPASQYVATRGAGGWATQNITAPIFSGSYESIDQGVPYQLFSADLSRALLLNGDHCRGGGTGCAVANPPLAGTDAPAGYQNYYLREGAGFGALLGAAVTGYLTLGPAGLDLRLAGASPDLRHAVLSTCAALTPDATQVELGESCDPDEQNLYEYSQGAGLSLVNVTPGAGLAAQSAAISGDGARVYWENQNDGNLYLREGASLEQVDADAGGGGSFETAAGDGSVAFFSKGEHLWRYEVSAGSASDLTPSGGVVGVLGASGDGDHLYYQDAGGLELWHDGITTEVAPGAAAADASNYPPSTGTARVAADGSHLLFVSSAQIGEYDNTDLISEEPDSEVYLYDAGGGTLICVSCNPTNERPIGPSTIPGAVANGTAPGSTNSYKPRALSSDGRRVFFDSADTLALTDTNTNILSGAGINDVYQWEAEGTGSCTRVGGCVALISSGRSSGGAGFVDASADGADVFFLTDDSLVKADPGAVDLYDARVGGGFADPPTPIPCEGDACQALPSAPTDPTLTTRLAGPGNAGVRYVKHCTMGLVKRKGKCVRRHDHRGKKAGQKRGGR